MTDQRAYAIAALVALAGAVVWSALSVFGDESFTTAAVFFGTGGVLLAMALLDRYVGQKRGPRTK